MEANYDYREWEGAPFSQTTAEELATLSAIVAYVIAVTEDKGHAGEPEATN
jgi:hypothetical protein